MQRAPWQQQQQQQQQQGGRHHPRRAPDNGLPRPHGNVPRLHATQSQQQRAGMVTKGMVTRWSQQQRAGALPRPPYHTAPNGPPHPHHLTWLCYAPYVSYGVKYIGLVSLDATRPATLTFYHRSPFFQNGLKVKSGFEMYFDIGPQHHFDCRQQRAGMVTKGMVTRGSQHHLDCRGQTTFQIQNTVYPTLYLRD